MEEILKALNGADLSLSLALEYADTDSDQRQYIYSAQADIERAWHLVKEAFDEDGEVSGKAKHIRSEWIPMKGNIKGKGLRIAWLYLVRTDRNYMTVAQYVGARQWKSCGKPLSGVTHFALLPKKSEDW